jgi:hypothetical protein
VAKIKQLLRGLVAVCLFLGLCGGYQDARAQVPATSVNQFADLATVDTNWHINQTIPDSYELIAENTLFQLYVNKDTLAFKVVDKRSGYVWSSNLDEKQEGDRLNKTWTAFAQSGISIDYLDQKATSKRASITNTNKAIDIASVDQGIRATVHFLDPIISLDVIIKLETNSVSVEIPFSSVKEESPDYKLGTLYTFPFFGATRVDSVPGYMFIPDGSGSLIQFAATTKATNMFYGKYYGADLGMLTTIPYDPTVNPSHEISIPVIGMVHGVKQNAYICIVEKGASYGEIQAHPAGIITNFNFMYNVFTYNQSYFQATNRSGDGVTILQPHTNAFDVKLQYRFLTQNDSDYVGMARSYQQYLVEKGVLKKITQPDGNIGIKLEFLGGDTQKVLVWNQLIKMTTVSQMGDILSGLGIKNPDVVYFGWQPLGASGMPPTSLRLDSGLGNVNELRSLADKISAGGGNFYLYLDPQVALKNEGGYSPHNDLAMSITNANLTGYSRGGPNYYLNLAAMSKRYTSLSEDVFSKLNAGLALDEIGSTLYGDFKKNRLSNREEAIAAYQDMLAKNQISTAFYTPNDYMFSYMKAYYDIPLTDSGYVYTTETVPFLQIVLAGYVPFYGPAINFSSNSRDDLLRQVEFDVYPSYFLTQEVTAKILNTHSDWIYTSSYAQWGREIVQTYQWMNSLLGPVEGQEIISRQTLANGVVATTYENGKQIIVNYNDSPFTYRGVTVESKDAVIREVAP